MSNAQWLGKHSRRIERRIVVQGNLVLETPAQFGSGDSDDLTDMPLLVDEYDGVSPLLTGATLAGALRAYLWSREEGFRSADPAPREKPIPDEDKPLTEILFGGFKEHDNGKQGALIIDDALGENFNVELRDGVRINSETRTADDNGLFNMQVWSAETTFPIRLELLLTSPKRGKDETDADFATRKSKRFTRLTQALLTALQGLTDGGITLGGRKNRGFGRISVAHWHVRQYDLTQPTQLMAWLTEGDKPLAKADCVEKLSEAAVFKDIKPAVDKRSYFQMEATFKLDGSLLIRATGQPNSNSPDMVHLNNHEGEAVLPGTSVTGALRQRTRRILQLVNEENSAAWLTDLFGDEEMQGKFKASRLIVEETIIEQPVFNLVQNRVAIDRFTGGALESALFNEQPVFGANETRLHVNLVVREPEDHDIGLLLLLLKDLWTGDLPLGGEISVGRGRLAGISAELTYFEQGKTKTWSIERGDENGRLQMTDGTAADLQKFVNVLHGKGEGDGSEN